MNTSKDNIQIQQLMSRVEERFAEISRLHDRSLKQKELVSEIQPDIKECLEHLRSVLDYLAHDIAEFLNIKREGKKIYFPIVKVNHNFDDFKGRVGKSLPGLEFQHKPLFDILEKFQPYHAGREWLGFFATLVTNIKHVRLSILTEKKIKLIGLGENIAVGGSGATFRNCKIEGVEITQLSLDPDTDISSIDPRLRPWKNDVWVNLIFEEIRQPVLPLLQKALGGIQQIVSAVYSYIDKKKL